MYTNTTHSVFIRKPCRSRVDIITINVNGETSRFGLGRCILGGGGIGKRPKIETNTNFLTISQGANKTTIRDNVKYGNTSNFEDNFIYGIVNIPSIFDFNDA